MRTVPNSCFPLMSHARASLALRLGRVCGQVPIRCVSSGARPLALTLWVACIVLRQQRLHFQRQTEETDEALGILLVIHVIVFERNVIFAV